MKKFFKIFALIICFIVPNIAFAEELIIFHTNDMHSRIVKGDDDGKSIGLAEISGAVKATKKKNSATFWFDAGDTFHGMPKINLSNGENLVPIFNNAGIDIFVPGNHDFNYGFEQLENLTKKLKFPTLSANIVRKSNSEKIFSPYKIFETAEGTKICVFGLTTPETAYKVLPSNVATINFLNPVEISQEMIKNLRPQCDVLICVMHMGVDEESEFTSKKIASETSGIDLIVDGHSHTELKNGLQVGETLIAQTGCYEHNLGKITVEIENHKIISKKAELLNAADVKKISEIPDKKIARGVEIINKRAEKYLSQIVAKSDRFLTGERVICRHEEAELGNLLADALRWKADAEIGFINGGSIRTSLPEGKITRGEILEIQPFQNKLVKIEITGKILREMLEHGVSQYPNFSAAFPQISGISFEFDCKKPVGQKVENILVGGENLIDEKIYTLATTYFVLDGGDDYKMLKNSKIVEIFETTDKVLIEYLNKVGMKGIELGRTKNLNIVPIQ